MCISFHAFFRNGSNKKDKTVALCPVNTAKLIISFICKIENYIVIISVC